jgi:hypothetical protein
MTLGQYPKSVPKQFLIPGLDCRYEGQAPESHLYDVAAGLDLNVNGSAGGVIADDFNNDGYIDIVTSGWDLQDPMHYFRNNNRNGTFSDMTESRRGSPALPAVSTFSKPITTTMASMDIFVLRGAWLTNGFGNQPSSLLRNNGDGTFTDVTTESRAAVLIIPTQAATWADFNNDGWLDVFIGTLRTCPPLHGGRRCIECMLYHQQPKRHIYRYCG